MSKFQNGVPQMAFQNGVGREKVGESSGGETAVSEPVLNGRSPTSIYTSIPRQETRLSPSGDLSPPRMRTLSFKAGRLQVFRRLYTWLYVLAFLLGGRLIDRLRRRDSVERQAVRLRIALENAGGTFIKIGQQLAMRIDLLPWVYTIELSKMLDKVRPFPFEQALETIDRSLGKSWQEIFAFIDPDPIGSASMSCVYQAYLKNGDRVAVKVRRPQIGEIFVADLKVMDWLFDFIEFLTIVRPGSTQNLRTEFRSTLMEELDFIQEARFQDIFRRKAKKSGKKFFKAPRIYFEFCSQEVIVEEFAEGMWLWEVMAGVEQGNQQALTIMQELNISPKKVAERLLWVNIWGMQENIIFHADPHPANVIVLKNSKLSFIDFGSSGSFDLAQRDAFRRITMGAINNDPEMMARATLKLIEPLPPVDIKELLQMIEAHFMNVLYVYNSKRKHTEWWEHTSMNQWLGFIKVTQSYNISINLQTLRMMRSTLLYDTIAVRLHNKIDRFEVFEKFLKYKGERARKRVSKQIERQLKQGGDEIYLKLEEISQIGDKLFNRSKDFLSSPILNFGSLIEKWVAAVTVVLSFVGRFSLVTFLFLAGFLVTASINQETVNLGAIFNDVITNRFYLFIVVTLILLNVRYALFRMRDPEI